MRLLILHPEVAARDCRHCWEWHYDETGPNAGKVHQRHGQPMRRITTPPCTKKTGCPKGHIDDQKGLTEQNWRTYEHYLECKATGNFPDDPIVRRNAGIIRAVEDAVERSKRDELLMYMRAVVRGALQQ